MQVPKACALPERLIGLRHVKDESDVLAALHGKTGGTLRPRSKPLRHPRGTGINSLCRMISGRWRLMQQNAETRSEGSCFEKKTPGKLAENLEQEEQSFLEVK